MSAGVLEMIKLVVFILFVVVACQAISDQQVIQEWKSFQEKTQKHYRSPVESAKRFTIFKENLEKIEAHNSLFDGGNVTYKMGVTKFTDLTSEEFLQYVNKYKMVPKKSGNIYKNNSLQEIAHAIDWRKDGIVSNVKDQGSCGSCWAFSATGAIEGQRGLVYRDNRTLSEQNLIDCVTESHGCDGGNMDSAFEYVIANGIDREYDYPYEGSNGECRQNTFSIKIDEYQDVEPDELKIQDAVGLNGPISVGIDATDELQNYISGILIDKTCSNTPNHGVLIVGYDNEDGVDYWIIKNSWGSNWGEDGYFRLVRNQGACAITSMASVAIIHDSP